MNNEVLNPVAIKDAQAVPEEMVQTPPDLPEVAQPEPVVEAAPAPAPAPAPAIAVPSLDDSSLYIHREL
jgi:polyphosphate kinase